jgi:hypothetical protein
MELEELEQYNPDLVAEIRSDAAAAEREPQARLDEMMAAGLEAIIAKGRKNTAITPETIALECLTAIQESGKSDQRVSALKRDAASASRPPGGDAPRWKAIVGKANANGRRSR